jgi:hypothetical protein
MIYNIDTEAAGKGNDTAPLGRCTIGWAILNGTDPRQVLARAPAVLVIVSRPSLATSTFSSP